MGDRQEYLAKKRFFSRLLTIYGRKPVLEALETEGVNAFRLHLADSNKPAAILEKISDLALKKDAELQYHSREALSRISKNQRQDQGVALDLELEGFETFEDFLAALPESFELIALDKITNPQNLGMIIRSVCASPLRGLLLSENGGAKIDSLVIKASAGTLFKAPIIRCADLGDSLNLLAEHNTQVIGLDLSADNTLSSLTYSKRRVFVLGNESDGLSPEVSKQCNMRVKIPMAKGVESLNVAITAALIAFRSVIAAP